MCVYVYVCVGEGVGVCVCGWSVTFLYFRIIIPWERGGGLLVW